MAKISGVFKRIKITAGDDEALLLKTPNLFFIGNLEQKRLVPVEPELFGRVEDDALASFGESVEGDIAFAFNPLYPKIGTYERVPWYETIWVQLGLVGFCTLFLLSAAIVWLIRPLIQKIRDKQPQGQPFRWALVVAGEPGCFISFS